jgi:N utilization substance protein B
VTARRRARETALAVLFSEEFGPSSLPAALADLIEDEPAEYALELVEGVRAHRDALDERIRRASRHWRVERMSLIDRNVIRIAAFEILELGLERAIAIDEAVEIARRYGDTESSAFVNGVRDAIAKAA